MRIVRDGLAALVTTAAAAGACATMWLLAGLIGGGPSSAVLATVVALSLARRSFASRAEFARSAALLPAIGLAAGLVGWLLVTVPPAGAAVFVAGMSLPIWLRRFGPRAARLGALIALPLTAMLVVPVAPAAGAPWWVDAVLVVVAGVVAVVWVAVAREVLLAGRLAVGAGGRGAGGRDGAGGREAAGADGAGAGAGGRGAGGREAAEAGGAGAGAGGQGAGGNEAASGREAAGADARAGAGAGSQGAGGHEGAGGREAAADAPAPPPASAEPARRTRPTRAPRRLPASTRMALQMAVALAVAFVVGWLGFPGHGMWVVLTAFIVCSGNRGRGDVVHKSALRVVGALVGTVGAVGVAFVVVPGGFGGVVVIFVALFAGTWLRTYSYAFWALAVTLVLAMLQGMLGTVPGGGALEAGMLGERMLAIVVGAVIGVAVSWFLLPVRSSDVLRKRLAELLAGLGGVLTAEAGERAARVAEFRVAAARVEELAPAHRARRLVGGRRRVRAIDCIEAAGEVAAALEGRLAAARVRARAQGREEPGEGRASTSSPALRPALRDARQSLAAPADFSRIRTALLVLADALDSGDRGERGARPGNEPPRPGR